MKLTPKGAIIIVLVLLIVCGLLYWAFESHLASSNSTASSTAATSTASAQNTVSYSCNDDKTIAATYGTTSVKLALSDGRSFDLPQVESGSGIRYEQGQGTAQDIQFSSEGSSAFLEENGTMTYSNCVGGISVSVTPGASNGNVMLKSYTDPGKTFTFNYPNSLTLSGGGPGYTQDWMLNSPYLGLVLVKLTLPSSFEPGTNFNEATLTVGTSADPNAVAQCLEPPQNGPPAAKAVVMINGTQYSEYQYNDAAAGSEYQTVSYRTLHNGQCYVVEYTIHSGNIDNYPLSSGIKAFDVNSVQQELQDVVQSFRFLS